VLKNLKTDVERIRKFWYNNYDEAFNDHQFRKLEFEAYLSEIRPGQRVLDIGCGKGDVVFALAEKVRSIIGSDFQSRRIRLAQHLMQTQAHRDRIGFQVGDILNLGFADDSFDRVITARTLINLPDLGLQKKGIKEVARILKPSGRFLCLEVTQEGWAGYNAMRELFGLDPVVCPWRNLPLGERKFLNYVRRYFRVRRVERFGMYYFLSRIVHPLLVAPESPSFDHPINQIAADISRKLSHPFSEKSVLDKASYYVFFVLEKK